MVEISPTVNVLRATSSEVYLREHLCFFIRQASLLLKLSEARRKDVLTLRDVWSWGWFGLSIYELIECDVKRLCNGENVLDIRLSRDTILQVRDVSLGDPRIL